MTFVPGRELNAAFHAEVIAPLLAGRRYSAALLGYGSDVLGYDTPLSTDHGWGPRLLVFVPDADVETVRATIDAGLPERFHGRGFRVLDAGRFAAACRATVTDPWLLAQPVVGSVDQFSDSTDALSSAVVARRLGALFTSRTTLS